MSSEKFEMRVLFKALWSNQWAVHPEHRTMDLRCYDRLFLCLRDSERDVMKNRMKRILCQSTLPTRSASKKRMLNEGERP